MLSNCTKTTSSSYQSTMHQLFRFFYKNITGYIALTKNVYHNISKYKQYTLQDCLYLIFNTN